MKVENFLRGIADPDNAAHQAAIDEFVSMLQTSASEQFDCLV